jgi:cell wall-associated NlpC family hydrolase
MTIAARITALMICALGTGITGIAQAGPPQERAVRKSPSNQHTVKAPQGKTRASTASPAKLSKSPTPTAATRSATASTTATAATAAAASTTAAAATASTAAAAAAASALMSGGATLGPPVAVAAATAPSGTSASTDFAAEVVFRALSLLGVNYRFGGNSPAAGLDCSGLVRLVFSEVTGLTLPRRSDEMSRVGGSVDKSELQPGDLVFFNTLRMPFSHVGIFIGNGQFVHSPSSGSSVRVENMNLSYWQSRFNGARRLIAGEPLAAPVSALVVDTDASGAARRIDFQTAPSAASPAAGPAQRAPDNWSRSSLYIH